MTKGDCPLARKKRVLEGEVVGPDKFKDLGKWIATSGVARPLRQVDGAARVIEPKEE